MVRRAGSRMDPTLSFIYNIIQIIIFSSILTVGALLKIGRNEKAAGAIVGLFLFYLMDTVMIFMTEFLPDFMSWYDDSFIRTPSLKTVIFLGVGFFTLMCWSVLTGSNFTGVQGAMLFALSLWLVFVPLLTEGAIGSFIFYSGYQVFCIFISIFAIWRLRSIDCDRLLIPARRIRSLLIVTVLFCVLIMLEDFYVIFSVDNYDVTAGELDIYYRNVSEDMLRFIYSGLAAFFFVQIVRNRSAVAANALPAALAAREALIQESDRPSVSEKGRIQTPAEYKRMKFARSLALTDREEEVLTLLLGGKSNQEIGETLHISIGTVKAHVHGIFRKAKITHRYELLPLFESFNPAD